MKRKELQRLVFKIIVITCLFVLTGMNSIDASAKTIKCKSLTLAEECKLGIEYPISFNEVFSKITWKSANSKIASVDNNGLVKGKMPGKTTIIGISKGNTYKCKVTVKKANKVTLKKSSKKVIKKATKKIVKYLNKGNFLTVKIKTNSASKNQKILKQISKEITKTNEWKVTCQFYNVQKSGKYYITCVTPAMCKRYKLAQKYIKKSYEIFIREWKNEMDWYQSGEVVFQEEPNKKWERNFKCKIDTPYNKLSEESRLMFAQTHKYFNEDTMMEYGNINIFKQYGAFSYCQNPLTKNKDVLCLEFEFEYLGDLSLTKSVNSAYKKIINKKASGVCGTFTDAQWMINEDLNIKSWPVNGADLVHSWCIMRVKDINNKYVYYLSDNGIVRKINSEKDLKKSSVGNYVPSTKKAMGKAYPF